MINVTNFPMQLVAYNLKYFFIQFSSGTNFCLNTFNIVNVSSSYFWTPAYI